MATLTTSFQLIANKYIGTVSGSGVAAKDIYLRIYAKYNSQSIADNKSTVSYRSVLYVSGSGTYFYTGTPTTKSLGGSGASTTSGDASGNYYLGETTLSEISGTVAHSSAGSASVSVTASWNSTPWGVSGSVTGTADLPLIARATTPTISATSITMGGSATITMAAANSTFKHKLRYNFGSVKGSATGFSIGAEFTKQGTSTATFTPPTSLGSSIPNSTSGTCEIVCYTYLADGTHIGTSTINVTLSVPSYTPSITGLTLTGNNLLSSTYVQGKSTVKVTANLATQYGATTKSISATVDGKTYTALPFTTSALSAGSKTVKVTYTDSRNKSVTVESAAFTVYAYAAPTITSFTLVRQSNGTSVTATVQGSVASVNSKNAKTIKVVLNGVTNTITSSSYTINGTTTFTNVPTDSTLTGTATITDSYSNVSKSAVLPTVAVTMDFYKDGTGIAMGKVAESSNLLDVAWDERVRKNLQVDGTVNGINIRTGNYIFGGSREGITDENWVEGVPSFIGTYSQNNQWYSTLSLRHRNGWEDGISYGLQLRSILTQEDNLSWRQHINGTWKNWRTLLDSTNTADYVIEQGTSGIWTYRKWNSGSAECWGTYSESIAITKTWGSLYYSNSLTPRINYPFTFKSRPVETVTFRGNSVAGWLYGEGGGFSLNNTTQTAQYGVCRPTSIEAATLTFDYYVVGKWK